MAGAITFTYVTEPGMVKVTGNWTSDGTSTAVGTCKRVTGRLIKGITDPGSVAPTDNYDIAMVDEEGLDPLANCDDDLANRDTANTEEVYFIKNAGGMSSAKGHPAICDALTITVSNAGASKTGQVILYVATL